MDTHKQRLFRYLLAQRRKRGISLPTLARRTGYTVDLLRGWEAGRLEPSAEHVLCLARAMGKTRVDMEELRRLEATTDSS